jgi:methyltransferase OMS1
MGIATLRRDLSARARGHVLEVAVGTGRNLAHYDWSEVVSLSQDADEARAQRERERVVRMLDRRRLGGPTVRDDDHPKGRGEVAGEVGSAEGEVLSFTGVDVSGEMLGVARDRIREAVPGLKRIMRKRRVEEMPRLLPGVEGVAEEGLPVVDALEGRVRLVLGDAVRGLPPPPSFPEGKEAGTVTAPAPAKYDTIIQTFGLCSVADPGRLLANMADKLQPDTGRILLLEHGRGLWDWMNNRLDKSAPKHFQKFGCWWNRDIEKLVREAEQTVPGLEVVKLERPLWFQWGTTMLIELKVKSQPDGGHAEKKA